MKNPTCPTHGVSTVVRAVVHAKGCPGARAECVSTCYPRRWYYCTRCDWRHLIRPVRPDRELSPRLHETARFGHQVWRLRRAAGLSIIGLADLANVSESTVNFLESARDCIGRKTALRIIELLTKRVAKRPDTGLSAIAAAVPKRLGHLCRRARFELMITDITVAAADMRVDAAKLARFESGEGGFNEDEIGRVLSYLGVEAPQLDDAVQSVAWTVPPTPREGHT